MYTEADLEISKKRKRCCKTVLPSGVLLSMHLMHPDVFLFVASQLYDIGYTDTLLLKNSTKKMTNDVNFHISYIFTLKLIFLIFWLGNSY